MLDVDTEWMWTSGTDQGQEGIFVWMSTGKGFTYTHWRGIQPDNAGGNENCVHVWKSEGNGFHTWNDWICSKKLYYICEEKFAILPRHNFYK